ncbi:ribosomal protein S18 acetylase RimI-like enzyme [Geodermatophilus bullaregiensis]|uniref:GNAT family N-acetyltransferase n=1 Tax=Geodermatophilus bullaregiensis TaxID=1564160 RepID=UPI00195F1CCD|nr:GNAT family N-acetyltransferase [Geodermatophilus bullaregiensis]MBM7805920.1 ribosomal protein S18 acetylase RimI-like enzyme [Geodermatophilus bullaregiensis]
MRRRTARDLTGAVRVLGAVHAADGHPSRWPADPAAWPDPEGTASAWVAARDGAVAGHLAVVREPGGRAAVSRFFVAPDARGRHLGTALLAEAAARAAAEDVALVLDVVADAAPAIALYERLGWSLVGTRPADWTTPAGHRPLLRAYRAPRGT